MLAGAPFSVLGKRTAGEQILDVKPIDVIHVGFMDNGVMLDPVDGVPASTRLQIIVVFAEQTNNYSLPEAHVLRNGVLLKTIRGGGDWSRTFKPNDTWRSAFFSLDEDDAGALSVQVGVAFDDFHQGHQGNPAIAKLSNNYDLVSTAVTVTSFDIVQAAVQSGETVTLRSDVTHAYQMRFSNDGVAWSSWISFSLDYTWSLSSGVGTKTVWAQYRNTQLSESSVYTANVLVSDEVPRMGAIRAYDTNAKGTEYSSGDSVLNLTPYFEWPAASVVSGSIIGYATSIDGSDPATAVEQVGTSYNFVNAALANGTHIFKVRAISVSGTSAIQSFTLSTYSSSVAVTNLQLFTDSGLGTPVQNNAKITANALYATWDAVIGPSPVSYFYTLDGTDPDGASSTTGSTAAVDLTSLLSLGNNTIKVRAQNGLSGWSGIVTASVLYDTYVPKAYEARVLRGSDTFVALDTDSEVVQEITHSIHAAASASFRRRIHFDAETKWSGGETVTAFIGSTPLFCGTVYPIEKMAGVGDESVGFACFGSRRWLDTHTLVLDGASRFGFNKEDINSIESDGVIWHGTAGMTIGEILQYVFDNIFISRGDGSFSVEIPTTVLLDIDTTEFTSMTYVPEELQFDGVSVGGFIDEMLRDQPKYGWRVSQPEQRLVFKSFDDGESPVSLTVGGFGVKYADPDSGDITENRLSITPEGAITKIVIAGDAEVQQRRDIVLEEAWDRTLEDTWTREKAAEFPDTYGRVGRVYQWPFGEVMPRMTYNEGHPWEGLQNSWWTRMPVYKAFYIHPDNRREPGVDPVWTPYSGLTGRSSYYPHFWRGTFIGAPQKIDTTQQEIWFAVAPARPSYTAIPGNAPQYIYGALRVSFDERLGPYRNSVGPEGTAYTIFGITADHWIAKDGYQKVHGYVGATTAGSLGSVVRDDGADLTTMAQEWLDGRKEARISGSIRRVWSDGPHTDISIGTPVRIIGTADSQLGTLDARVVTIRWIPEEEITEYEFTLGTWVQGPLSFREKKDINELKNQGRWTQRATRTNRRDIAELRALIEAPEGGAYAETAPPAVVEITPFLAKTTAAIAVGASGTYVELDPDTGGVLADGRTGTGKNITLKGLLAGTKISVHIDNAGVAYIGSAIEEPFPFAARLTGAIAAGATGGYVQIDPDTLTDVVDGMTGTVRNISSVDVASGEQVSVQEDRNRFAYVASSGGGAATPVWQ